MAEDINRKKRRVESQVASVVGNDVEETFTLPEEEVAENNVVGDLEQDEDVLDWLPLDEETLTELSELLMDSPEEASSSLQHFNFKVKFIENPYISPVIVQSSSAYVTINGNEESCGSSFSDLESSVMASIDRCSVRSTASRGVCNGGAWSSDGLKARGMVDEIDDLERFLVRGIDGWDSSENGRGNADDDDVWVKFVADGYFGGPS